MAKRIVIVLFLFGVSIFFIKMQITDKAVRNFRMFDSAKMEGVIVTKSASQDRERFRLNNLPQEFVFMSKATSLNGFTFFYAEAKIGDSVVKPSHSDTLRVIKENTHQVWFFTFRKW